MRDKIPDRVGRKPLEFPTMIVLVGLSLLDLGPRLLKKSPPENGPEWSGIPVTSVGWDQTQFLFHIDGLPTLEDTEKLKSISPAQVLSPMTRYGIEPDSDVHPTRNCSSEPGLRTNRANRD